MCDDSWMLLEPSYIRLVQGYENICTTLGTASIEAAAHIGGVLLSLPHGAGCIPLLDDISLQLERNRLQRFSSGVKWLLHTCVFAEEPTILYELTRLYDCICDGARFGWPFEGVLAMDITAWVGRERDDCFAAFLETSSRYGVNLTPVFLVYGTDERRLAALQIPLKRNFCLETVRVSAYTKETMDALVLERLDRAGLRADRDALEYLHAHIRTHAQGNEDVRMLQGIADGLIRTAAKHGCNRIQPQQVAAYLDGGCVYTVPDTHRIGFGH